MKDNINIFGDEFITEVAQYIMEEREFSEIQKKYNDAKKDFVKNNKKRIKTISEIRKHKIEEIDYELEKSKAELVNLKNEIGIIFSKYCEINNHKYMLIERKIIGSTGRHSFRDGYEHEMILTYKCKVCGKVESEYHTGYGFSKRIEYERAIPYEIYDNKNLSDSSKSIRDIEKEIEQLENYIDYLLSLKNRLCELFGHDAKIIDENLRGEKIYQCECCSKRLSSEEYEKANSNAKYNCNDSQSLCIVRKPKEIKSEHLNLPTYEEYQKKLVLKKENEDKN